jgi:predicted CXXCH cytochrome family protein
MFTRKSLVMLAGLLVITALVILVSWSPATVRAQGPAPTAVAVAAPTGPGGGYVGAQVCAACHAPTAHDFAQTGHAIMSRPGFSQYLWKLAQEDQAEVAAVYPGFWDQLAQTMKELDKVGYDSNGVVWETPDKWAGKGVDLSKITIWSGGTLPGGDPKTSGLGEFMIRGSALTASDVITLTNAGIYAPDKWYVVGTYLQYKVAGFEGEVVSKEANCATGGCHVTGDQSKIKSSAAWTTGWLTKVAAGQTPDFELGVTCEACHGQGGNHVKAPSSNNIVNPARFSRAQQSAGGDGTVNLILNTTTNKYSFDATKSYLNASSGAKSCATCHSGNQGEFLIAKTNPPAKTIQGTPANNPHFDFTTGTGVDSCNTCHDAHTNSTDLGQLTSATAQKLCTQCHNKVPAITSSAKGWEQFMPIPAGDYRHWHGFSYPFPQQQ